MKYNYSDELKSVFKALSRVRKARGYAKLADSATDPIHGPVLRNAYLVGLKCELILLRSALDKWISAGALMERKSNDENN
ncbi:hypothetical protein [Butyricicoccus porcorum]|uniref:hypothetical protein n=1 Tax=Butyricicoccus porcorum TaxID=1945634 RepID=UPI001056647A|nr:hypothetical protein [Butyricicoccus porcorum]